MNSSNSADVALIHKVDDNLPAFYNTVGFLVIAREIRRWIRENGHDEFLQTLEISLINSMIHEWYKLFDVKGGDSYWKKMTVEHTVYCNQLYELTTFSYNEWTQFRNRVSSLRLEGILRKGNANTLSDDDLEILLSICRFTYSWLYEHAHGAGDGADDIFRPLDFIDTLISDASSRLNQISKA